MNKTYLNAKQMEHTRSQKQKNDFLSFQLQKRMRKKLNNSMVRIVINSEPFCR